MNRGIVLLVALWVLIILSMLAIGLGFRSSIDLRLVKYQKDSLNAFNLAKVGIQAAIYEKLSDFIAGEGGFKNVDNYTESWASNSDNFKPEDNPEGIIYSIIDESSKIDINHADLSILFNLLEQMQFTIDDEFRNKIKEYRDKKKFESIEELLLASGFEKEFLYGRDSDGDGNVDQEGIKDYITVYNNDKKININTANDKVLSAIIANPDLVSSIVAFVIQDESYFVQDPVDIGILETAINLSAPPTGPEDEWAPVKTMFANGILSVKSDIYRIKSQGRSGRVTKAIECVVDFSKLLTDKKVAYLYWHEY